MGEFFKQFFGFLVFSPLTAAVFGFGIWILPAVFLRDVVARLRLRFFHFFVSGYVFIAIMTIYLLVAGSRTKTGDRHHQAGPFVGMLASLALAWWLNRLLRTRFPRRNPGGPNGPGVAAGQQPGYPGANQHGYPGPNQPGYGHPAYRPQGYGQQPGYPPHPGYPGYPAYGPPQPTPPNQPPNQPPTRPDADGIPNQPRTPGVPWVVPPPADPAPPTTQPE
jgi:hypothetical protein